MPRILKVLRCALMAGINIVLTVFYVRYGNILKKQAGYPRFARIRIEKKNENSPK